MERALIDFQHGFDATIVSFRFGSNIINKTGLHMCSYTLFYKGANPNSGKIRAKIAGVEATKDFKNRIRFYTYVFGFFKPRSVFSSSL